MCVQTGRSRACEYLEPPIEDIILKDTCYSLCSKQGFCPSKAQYDGLLICQRYTVSYIIKNVGGPISLV